MHPILRSIAFLTATACLAGAALAQGQAASSVRGARDEPLTPAQLAKVRSVLAAYDAASLGVDDARSIKRALRDAGMRRGPSLDKAIVADGFDPSRLEALDPSPAQPPRQ